MSRLRASYVSISNVYLGNDYGVDRSQSPTPGTGSAARKIERFPVRTIKVSTHSRPRHGVVVSCLEGECIPYVKSCVLPETFCMRWDSFKMRSSHGPTYLWRSQNSALNRNGERCKWVIPITEHQASGSRGPGTRSKSSKELFTLLFGFNGPHASCRPRRSPFCLVDHQGVDPQEQIGVTASFVSVDRLESSLDR